ncbi:MAG: TIGR00341 family protein [Phycisphaerae bacterium]|nr:TIGR00341 family protein [Phycisphaerae bacterium]
MPLRLLQIVLPENNCADLDKIIDEAAPPSVYHTPLGDDLRMTSLLMHAHVIEALSDKLEDTFSSCDQFRLLLLPVEATRPRLEEPEKETNPTDEEPKQWAPRFGRISRDERDEDIRDSARTDPIYLIMVTLATIVACVGLLKDSPAIIIGAMVIAPLLGPNTALALGTTLGDFKLIRNAIRSNLIGLSLALAIAACFGLFFDSSQELNTEFASRTVVDLGDVMLALASGAAGAIAFTSGAPATIVGVMVAVALLPPTAAAGILAGAGSWTEAAGATTLAMTNIVCINLSATGVFLIQGVRPNSWWEKDRARSASIRALIAWSIALAALAALIIFAWAD